MLIYFNSFETSADTVGWINRGFTIANDAPFFGGKHSLYVSGGCVSPHARFEFQNKTASGYVHFSCWGKRLFNRGYVGLSVKNSQGRGISFTILDSVWIPYVAADSFYCAKDDTLQLTMLCGGFVVGEMLIDLISVTINK
jgi:hypothetical protein